MALAFNGTAKQRGRLDMTRTERYIPSDVRFGRHTMESALYMRGATMYDIAVVITPEEIFSIFIAANNSMKARFWKFLCRIASRKFHEFLRHLERRAIRQPLFALV